MAGHFWQNVPPPTQTSSGAYTANWNSVALFFNLVEGSRPADYRQTSVVDARQWLDEGEGFLTNANPTISDFMSNYWGQLSYGRFGFGVNTPRHVDGSPVIPELTGSAGNSESEVVDLVFSWLEANPEAVWKAAGSLTREGHRFIPSVVLVHNYGGGAWATLRAFSRNVSGQEYEIGRITHMRYNVDFTDPNEAPGVPAFRVRGFWATLAHEYAHNFLGFGDFYGPAGCTGYWDLLGDNLTPGRMSEVSSGVKASIEWLSFKQSVHGPVVEPQVLTLRPYTTFGDAIKVVPDPEHNPLEYFLLEYRKSTGPDLWIPDRALPEEGLLIIHMNERLGLADTFLLREAPYFDPEFADFSDDGGALWTGHTYLSGVLYPQPELPLLPRYETLDAFTPNSRPSSDFYGGRTSGLSITSIQVADGEVTFRLAINCRTQAGWTVSDRDRCVAGRFSPESQNSGQEIFCRNDTSAALLEHRQAQWFVRQRHESTIAGWSLGSQDYELVGDLDKDGFDEIYIRSPEWAGVLKWNGSSFSPVTVQHEWIGGWRLGGDNREFTADVDGDGQKEIFIRSPQYAGVLKLVDGSLQAVSIQSGQIGEWILASGDRHHVGRFTRPDREEILVRSPEALGLFEWQFFQQRFHLLSCQNTFIDGWRLGGDNWECVGDFDGDGLDEIYIRSPQWAGVMKWNGSRFVTMWIREGTIEELSSAAGTGLELTPDDQSHVGVFLTDRLVIAGRRHSILHRSARGVAILSWEFLSMRVRLRLNSPFSGRWHLGAGDKYVLGDFHRIAKESDPLIPDLITDELTDVFMHNGWGTGMLGFNYIDEKNYQAGLTWINARELLVRKADGFMS